MKPRLLDLFSGASIGGDGYRAAGFEVVSVDNRPQPECPPRFCLRDALAVLDGPSPEDFDVIHASPPCEMFTRAKHLRDAQGGTSSYGDLLTPTLELLRERWGHKVWIVENVDNAWGLMQPEKGEWLTKLCGSMFGLQVQRHRLFLSNVSLDSPECDHESFPFDPVTGKPRPWGVYHVPGDSIPSGGRTARDVEHGREVMGVTREVSWAGLKDGIPPSYTRHLGAQLLAHLSVSA